MRDIKFRFWDKDLKKMLYKKPAHNDFCHPNIVPMQFTGFRDKFGTDIYEGDIISDWTETDEGLLESNMQVFWNEPTGSWHLDNSSRQDQSYSVDLWLELNDFEYAIKSNIFECRKEKIKEKESTS